MAKKKHVAMTDDMPMREPPTDSAQEIWDPAGNNTRPDPLPEDHNAHVIDWRAGHQTASASPPGPNDETELQEFIAAVRAVVGPNTEIETPGSV